MNDYYIPQRETTADRIGKAASIADTVQQMSLRPKEFALRERMQGSNERGLDIKERGMEIDKAQGEKRLQLLAQGNNIARAQMAQNERLQNSRLPIHMQKALPSQVTKLDMMISGTLGKEGSGALEWYRQKFNKAVDSGMTRGDMYSTFKSQWPNDKRRMLESMDSVLEKKRRNPVDFEKWAGSTEGMAFMNLKDAIHQDQDGSVIYDQGIFAQTAGSIANERMKVERTRAAAAMTAKQQMELPFKFSNALRAITHDKEGKPLKNISTQQIEGLRQSANQAGFDIQVIDLPDVEKNGPFNDLKKMKLPILMQAGQQPRASQIKQVLVNDYQMSEADADRYIDAIIGK